MLRQKNFQKKPPAHGHLGSAAKWAEMAADHENGQNSKKEKKNSPAHGHYVAG